MVRNPNRCSWYDISDASLTTISCKLCISLTVATKAIEENREHKPNWNCQTRSNNPAKARIINEREIVNISIIDVF